MREKEIIKKLNKLESLFYPFYKEGGKINIIANEIKDKLNKIENNDYQNQLICLYEINKLNDDIKSIDKSCALLMEYLKLKFETIPAQEKSFKIVKK